MLLLDENSSGSIPKKEFEEALKTVKENALAPSLDIETLVENIYGDNPTLSRKSIRVALVQNQEVIESGQCEPI